MFKENCQIWGTWLDSELRFNQKLPSRFAQNQKKKGQQLSSFIFSHQNDTTCKAINGKAQSLQVLCEKWCCKNAFVYGALFMLHPRKTKMEPQKMELWMIMFMFKKVISRFQSFVFVRGSQICMFIRHRKER